MRRLGTLSALSMATMLMNTPALMAELPAPRVVAKRSPPPAHSISMPVLRPNPNSPRASVPGSVRRRLARQGGGDV